MTQSAALLRLRALLNETSAGFWTDTQLYAYLDMAQGMVVEFLVTKTYESRRAGDDFYRNNVLEPLSTLDSSNTTSTSVREYTLPTDFLMTDYCEYYPTLVRPLVKARLDSFNSIMWKEQNVFLIPTAAYPSYYIRGNKIGFSPVPTSGGATSYLHYYYKRPTEIAAGTASNEIPIGQAGHEAVVISAFALALKQDGKSQESELEIQTAYSIIKNLQ